MNLRMHLPPLQNPLRRRPPLIPQLRMNLSPHVSTNAPLPPRRINYPKPPHRLKKRPRKHQAIQYRLRGREINVPPPGLKHVDIPRDRRKEPASDNPLRAPVVARNFFDVGESSEIGDGGEDEDQAGEGGAEAIFVEGGKDGLLSGGVSQCGEVRWGRGGYGVWRG